MSTARLLYYRGVQVSTARLLYRSKTLSLQNSITLLFYYSTA